MFLSKLAIAILILDYFWLPKLIREFFKSRVNFLKFIQHFRSGPAIFAFKLFLFFLLCQSHFPPPVKNGWQFEQISTVDSPTLEDSTFQVEPHAQRNDVILYSGCILGFICKFFATIFYYLKVNLFIHHIKEVRVFFEFIHFFYQEFQSLNHIKLGENLTQHPNSVKICSLN